MGKRRPGAGASFAASRMRAQVLVVFSSLLMAGQAATELSPQGVQGRCEIRFVGSSTLHDFSGAVSARAFQLEPHTDPSNGNAWWSGSIETAVADMDTGVERRDRNMRAMFDADRSPLIIADFPNVSSSALSDARGGAEPNVDFNLTIREVERPIAAKISHWTEDEGHASFDAEFEVSLESFGLEVPPVLGLLRVGDVVTVRAHLILDGLPAKERKTAALVQPPGFLASGS